MNQSSERQTESILMEMDALRSRLAAQLDHSWKRRREVVFFPWRGSCWGMMEDVWRMAARDRDWQCFVVPVPWHYRDALGNVQLEAHACGTEEDPLPADVPVIPAADYDPARRRPDLAIIQNPWDDCNISLSVSPEYYSSRLKACAGTLVCLPLFHMEGFEGDGKSAYNIKYLADTPGAIRSDLVVTESEAVRAAYIEALSRFAGEETRPRWSRQIIARDRDPAALWARLRCVAERREETK